MFRPIVPHQHSRVTYVELFFDLVFVFAVTQISHTLLAHFTPLGALQVTLLFLAVWWVWVFTSWVTNWLNPEKTPVRLLLFAMMLGGLVLSTSIPAAFEARGLWFAIAYAAMQVGKTIFLWLSTPPSRPRARMNAIRIAAWLSMSAVFWIAGGVMEGQSRLTLWAIALVIEYISPAVRFWIPRYGASSVADWMIEGGHMAERCALFIIIALGESIVVIGATFAELTWTTENVLAFVSAFVGSLAMWWIYFHIGAEAGSEQLSKSSEPGRLARLAYTYLHMPIVAGIIVSAVADELVLKHPGGHSDLKTVISAIGGPLLFLFGTVLFKHSFRGFLQLSHGVGIVALGVLAWFASELSPLVLSILTTAIMIVVAVWESISLQSDPAG
ncbi:low temperature requirement protein A [Bradyrhizobium sp. AUGA SZCCT0283]|nr:low temperature requirement protein A [Bradyrhizobium sp. AUGA SZCCT0283]